MDRDTYFFFSLQDRTDRANGHRTMTASCRSVYRVLRIRSSRSRSSSHRSSLSLYTQSLNCIRWSPCDPRRRSRRRPIAITGHTHLTHTHTHSLIRSHARKHTNTLTYLRAHTHTHTHVGDGKTVAKNNYYFSMRAFHVL